MGHGSIIRPMLAGCMAVLALVASTIADSASAGQAAKNKSPKNPPVHARSYVLEGRHRGYRRFGTQRIPLPVGPAYIYYDYPYSYSRGHYPTHIGGYVYYIPKSAARCSRRACAARRGSPLSMHQREACRCR